MGLLRRSAPRNDKLLIAFVLVNAGKSASDQVFRREPVEDLESRIRYPAAMLNFGAVFGPVLTVPRETSDFYRKAHVFLELERRHAVGIQIPQPSLE